MSKKSNVVWECISYKTSQKEDIAIAELFGWYISSRQTIRENGSQVEKVVMFRRTDLDNHPRMEELEREYRELNKSLTVVYPYSWKVAVLCALIFFVPLIIYSAYKVVERKDANRRNEPILEKMNALKLEAEKMLPEFLENKES